MKSHAVSLEELARTIPDKVCCTMLDNKGNESRSLTYRQFWEDTGKIASHIKSLGKKLMSLIMLGMKPGERVIFFYPIHSVIEYLVAFFGYYIAMLIHIDVYVSV